MDAEILRALIRSRCTLSYHGIKIKLCPVFYELPGERETKQIKEAKREKDGGRDSAKRGQTEEVNFASMRNPIRNYLTRALTKIFHLNALTLALQRASHLTRPS